MDGYIIWLQANADHRTIGLGNNPPVWAKLRDHVMQSLVFSRREIDTTLTQPICGSVRPAWSDWQSPCRFGAGLQADTGLYVGNMLPIVPHEAVAEISKIGNYRRGEVSCCVAWRAKRIHWWTQRWLWFLEWWQWSPQPQLQDVVWCSEVHCNRSVVELLWCSCSCSCRCSCFVVDGVEIVML